MTVQTQISLSGKIQRLLPYGMPKKILGWRKSESCFENLERIEANNECPQSVELGRSVATLPPAPLGDWHFYFRS